MARFGPAQDIWTFVLYSLLFFSRNSARNTHRTPLALWIDRREVEQFAGDQSTDYYAINHGIVIPYLQNAYLDTSLFILPPDITLVELRWLAQDDLYRYKFSILRSLDPNTVYDPLLSIPRSGFVPFNTSVFTMIIACTDKVTAVASVYLVLEIYNSRGVAIQGSPLRLQLRKQCIGTDHAHACPRDCENGGTCSDQGRCRCARGYYGPSCQYAGCFPECINNGTCVSPGKCACSPGYTGRHCEQAVCSSSCHNGGTCVTAGVCACLDGFYGPTCQFSTAICKRSCGVHGRCVAYNQCECYRGWRGRRCNKTKNSRLANRKRRRDDRNFANRLKRRSRKQSKKSPADPSESPQTGS